MLIETLKRHWWVPVLRGIAAIIFGLIAFTHPRLAAATLVLFFGAWVLIDGIFRVIGALGHRASFRVRRVSEAPAFLDQIADRQIGAEDWPVLPLVLFHPPDHFAHILLVLRGRRREQRLGNALAPGSSGR